MQPAPFSLVGYIETFFLSQTAPSVSVGTATHSSGLGIRKTNHNFWVVDTLPSLESLKCWRVLQVRSMGYLQLPGTVFGVGGGPRASGGQPFGPLDETLMDPHDLLL